MVGIGQIFSGDNLVASKVRYTGQEIRGPGDDVSNMQSIARERLPGSLTYKLTFQGLTVSLPPGVLTLVMKDGGKINFHALSGGEMMVVSGILR